MRTELELRKLEAQLSRLTQFIAGTGNDREFKNKDFDFACNAQDTISWVLGEVTTEHFTGEGFIDIDTLQKIAYKIEIRTGVMMDDNK